MEYRTDGPGDLKKKEEIAYNKYYLSDSHRDQWYIERVHVSSLTSEFIIFLLCTCLWWKRGEEKRERADERQGLGAGMCGVQVDKLVTCHAERSASCDVVTDLGFTAGAADRGVDGHSPVPSHPHRAGLNHKWRHEDVVLMLPCEPTSAQVHFCKYSYATWFHKIHTVKQSECISKKKYKYRHIHINKCGFIHCSPAPSPKNSVSTSCGDWRAHLLPSILTMFYRRTIESILSSCIAALNRNGTTSDRKSLQLVVRTAEKITRVSLLCPGQLYNMLHPQSNQHCEWPHSLVWEEVP